MRVLELQFTNHPVLGSLNVNLRQPSGQPSQLVVIAGENGSGKTLILNAIYSAIRNTQASSRGSDSGREGEVLVIVKNDGEKLPNIQVQTPSGYGYPTASDEIDHPEQSYGLWMKTVGVSFRRALPSRHMTNGEWQRSSMPDLSSRDCVFNEAAHMSLITERGSSSSKIASDLNSGRSGSFNLGTEITKLLIELRHDDQEDLATWCEQNPGVAPVPAQINKRWSRFSTAFSSMFPNRRLFSLTEDRSSIQFKQGGELILLEDFSGGEQQIIFRGAFLLRSLEGLSNPVILIDEPETGLHPRWQERILNFYTDIASGQTGGSSQIIVATHSPFIIHGTPNAKHIILSRQDITNIVQILDNPKFPGVTNADIAVAAFDMTGFIEASRNKQLVLFVEGRTDKQIIEIAWQKLRGADVAPFEIIIANCAKSLNSLLRDKPLLSAVEEANRTIVGLFDFDEEGYNGWNGAIPCDTRDKRFVDDFHIRRRSNSSVWAMLLPVPNFRINYAGKRFRQDSRLTIELMFPDKLVGEFLEEIYNAGGGSYFAIKKNSKNALVKKITTAFPEEFTAFEPLFVSLNRIASMAVSKPSRAKT